MKQYQEVVLTGDIVLINKLYFFYYHLMGPQIWQFRISL